MSLAGRLSSRAVQLGFLVALFGSWHLATTVGGVSHIFLPRLGAVLVELGNLLRSGAYLPDLEVTVFELVVAFALASTLGCTAGYLVSRSRFSIRVFDPLFAGLYAIPGILVYPLFLLFFGLGPESKIAIAVAVGFFPVVLNTIAGFGNVDRVYVTAARSMGASGAQMFFHVLLPAAFPVILTGLRMAFIIGLLVILGAETIASFAGLGHKIVMLAEGMRTAEMFAYIIFVVCIALVLNSLGGWVERRGRRHLGE